MTTTGSRMIKVKIYQFDLNKEAGEKRIAKKEKVRM